MDTNYSTRCPTVFVRLTGRNGYVREYKAMVNSATDYCFLPRVDAYRLGYPEASHDDPVTTPANLVRLATSNGYIDGMMIFVEQVQIGDLKIAKVPFLAFDIPQVTGYDVVLGRTFFNKGLLRMELDFTSANLKLGTVLAEGGKPQ